MVLFNLIYFRDIPQFFLAQKTTVTSATTSSCCIFPNLLTFIPCSWWDLYNSVLGAENLTWCIWYWHLGGGRTFWGQKIWRDASEIGTWGRSNFIWIVTRLAIAVQNFRGQAYDDALYGNRCSHAGADTRLTAAGAPMQSPYNALLGAFAKLRKATISLVMSVRPSARNNSPATGRIFMKFDIWVFLENLERENSSFIEIWQE